MFKKMGKQDRSLRYGDTLPIKMMWRSLLYFYSMDPVVCSVFSCERLEIVFWVSSPPEWFNYISPPIVMWYTYSSWRRNMHAWLIDFEFGHVAYSGLWNIRNSACACIVWPDSPHCCLNAYARWGIPSISVDG